MTSKLKFVSGSSTAVDLSIQHRQTLRGLAAVKSKPDLLLCLARAITALLGYCDDFCIIFFYVAGKPGSKPHKACQLNKEVGVLISGCADQETSADAQDPIQPGKAYGAMTNALVTVVRQHYDQYPSTPLTNR